MNQYAYDGEGRLCVVYTSLSKPYDMYVYDANGERVAKGSLSPSGGPVNSLLCDPSKNSFSVTESYTLLLNGQQIQVFNSGLWKNDNIYANGQMLATYSGTGQYYQMSDWLGTRRAQVTADGNPANLVQYTSLPFGDGQTTIGSAPDTTGLHYTGKERDNESGLDYFGARYYASSMGRWMSPDWADKPEAVAYSHLDNSQSLNLYNYVGNNPLSKPDLDGHGCPPDCTAEGWFGAAVSETVAIGTAVGEGIEAAALAPVVLTGAALGQIFSPKALGDPAEDAFNARNAAAAAAGTKAAPAGPKAADAPGVTAGGQATDKYGNKVGPSGKPQVDQVDHSGKKGAKDAARNEGKGKPEQHASPKKGDPHYHPTDANGEKEPTSTHHNYPQ